MGDSPWRGVQESSLIFRDHLLQAQEDCTLRTRKTSKVGRRLAWIKKELLTRLRHKKEAIQEEEAGTGDQEQIQRCYPGMQRWV